MYAFVTFLCPLCTVHNDVPLSMPVSHNGRKWGSPKKGKLFTKTGSGTTAIFIPFYIRDHFQHPHTGPAFRLFLSLLRACMGTKHQIALRL